MRLAWLPAVVLFVAVVPAQNIPSASQPVFRANAKLVQVTVVAHRSDGATVAGLTRGDFEILDNGQRQSISTFEASGENNEPAPSGTFGAVQDRRSPVRGPTVILLDWLNTSVANQMFARRQTIQALAALPAREKIQLLELDPGRLHALQDFTSDRELLVRALSTRESQTLQQGGSNSAIDPSCPAPGGRGISTGAIEQLRLLHRRLDDSLNAFELIAEQLAEVPGRKTLIWVTGGFPMPACDNTPIHLEPAVQALKDANVAVYAVDARGLVSSPMPTKAGNEVSDNAASMSIFADRTGGRLYYNRNDVDAEILKAEDDLRVSYTLGFYRESGSDDDARNHKVTVRSLARGVELRYWDSTPVARHESAAGGGAANAMAPLTATMTRQDGSLSVQLHIGPRSLTLGETNGRWVGGGQLAAWFVLADGRAAGDAVLKTISADLTAENHAKLLANGFDYRLVIPIPELAVTVKLKLSDQQSGQAGKLSVPVTLIPGERQGSE